LKQRITVVLYNFPNIKGEVDEIQGSKVQSSKGPKFWSLSYSDVTSVALMMI